MKDLRNYQYNLANNKPVDFDKDVTSIAECINPMIVSFLALINFVIVIRLILTLNRDNFFKSKKYWIYCSMGILNIGKYSFNN